jgi:hypothetical protein
MVAKPYNLLLYLTINIGGDHDQKGQSQLWVDTNLAMWGRTVGVSFVQG